VRALRKYLGFTGREPMPRQLQRMMLGLTLSAMGNGMVMPFYFIYLTNIRGIDTAIAGLILGWGGVVALAAAPLMGTGIDRFGGKRVLPLALLISSLGSSLMAYVNSPLDGFFSVTVAAIGQAGMWPAETSINTQLTADHRREHLYGVQFALLNFGIGFGALIGAIVVDVESVRTFQYLFFANTFTFVIYSLAVLSLKRLPELSRREEADLGRWSDVLADRHFVRFWWVALGAFFFGYSQIEVGFASFVVNVAQERTEVLAWAAAANTGTIAIFQLWFIARVQIFPRRTGLVTAILVWAFAWVCIAVGGLVSGLWLPTLLFVGGWIVFAVGEMLWSPLAPAIVNQMAPDHLRGRYNSANAAAYQIAAIFGPVIAGALIGHGLAWYWITGCIGGSLLTAFAASRINLPERIERSP
jgi:MFS family permease